MKEAPLPQPRITNSADAIDTLRPRIGFMAAPHDAVQVCVESAAGTYDSGTVETADYSLISAQLAPGLDCSARVRVRAEGSWSEWSGAWRFQTPPEPVLRIVRPAHAGSAIGPDIEVCCEIESASPLAGVRASLDERTLHLSAAEDGLYRGIMSLEDGMHCLRVEAEAGGQSACALSEFWVWNSPRETGEIVVLDLSEAGSWPVSEDPAAALRMYDLMHAAACLQGLANRSGPRLQLRCYDQDDEWLGWLSRPGAWLAEAPVRRISRPGEPEKALFEAIALFRDAVRGLVVWDPGVPATSNVATTAAGVEDLLPLRAGSALASGFQSLGLEVSLDLSGKFTGTGHIPDTEFASTGSAKCDACLWAKARYLDTGRANARVLGYWLDAYWLQRPGRMPWWEHCLTNHDWIVRNRGFVFDLSNWGDEAPQDDPGQTPGTDLETFKAILLSAYEQAGGEMIQVSGFTPWAFKYTNHADPPGAHEPVATEWEVVRVLSAYNCYLDADAHGLSAMANASLWTQAPLPPRFVQTPPPTRASLQARGFLDGEGVLAPLAFTLFYIGDFDSAAWLYRREMALWRDEARGSVPMGWAFNPNLCARMAPAFLYAFSRMSANDWLTAGDSGAGYVNPAMLCEPRPISGLPSGEAAWIRHCRELYRRFNLRITGFLINGHAGPLTRESEAMTAAFSPDGAATQAMWMAEESHLNGPMPVALQHHDLCPDNEANIACMQRFRRPGTAQFLDFRMILQGPSLIRDLMNDIRRRYPGCAWEALDPYAFFYLLRHSLGGANTRRATFTFDSIPAAVPSGQAMELAVGVRNDGWDTWEAGDVWLEAGAGTAVDWASVARADLAQAVPPGGSAVVRVSLSAPSAPGECLLYYDLASAEGGFREAGNPWWEGRFRAR